MRNRLRRCCRDRPVRRSDDRRREKNGPHKYINSLIRESLIPWAFSAVIGAIRCDLVRMGVTSKEERVGGGVGGQTRRRWWQAVRDVWRRADVPTPDPSPILGRGTVPYIHEMVSWLVVHPWCPFGVGESAAVWAGVEGNESRVWIRSYLSNASKARNLATFLEIARSYTASAPKWPVFRDRDDGTRGRIGECWAIGPAVSQSRRMGLGADWDPFVPYRTHRRAKISPQLRNIGICCPRRVWSVRHPDADCWWLRRGLTRLIGWKLIDSPGGKR